MEVETQPRSVLKVEQAGTATYEFFGWRNKFFVAGLGPSFDDEAYSSATVLAKTADSVLVAFMKL